MFSDVSNSVPGVNKAVLRQTWEDDAEHERPIFRRFSTISHVELHLRCGRDEVILKRYYVAPTPPNGVTSTRSTACCRFFSTPPSATPVPHSPLLFQHVLGHVKLHPRRGRGDVVRRADEDGAEHELQLHRFRHGAHGAHAPPPLLPHHHGQGAIEADGPQEQVFRPLLTVREHVRRGRGESGRMNAWVVGSTARGDGGVSGVE